MDSKKDIEKLFKDQFENFEVDPGNDVWSNIKSEISSNPSAQVDTSAVGSKIVSSSSSWMSTVIIGAIITGTIIGSYFFFEKKTESKKIKTSKANQIESTENTFGNKSETSNGKIKEVNKTYSSNTNKAVDKKEKSKYEITSTDTENKIPSNKENNPVEEETILSQDTESTEVPSKSEIEEVETVNFSEKSESSNELQTEDGASNDISNKASANTNTPKNLKEDKTHSSSNSNISENSDLVENDKSEEELITEQLNTFPLPNVFTPNQDGKNEFFEVNIEESGIDGIEVAIFDKTGNLIKQWNNPFDKWDGNLQDGTAASTGIYLYQIILKKGTVQVPRKGVITLNR